MATAHAPALILLIGRNGQIGRELAGKLGDLGRVVALDRQDLDLENPDQIRRVLRDTSPQVIVNAAGYTAVDRAEQDETTCMRVNAHGPAILAEEAFRLGSLLVHYSTDYVFDGAKAGPYLESDRLHPLNVYGKSKQVGEEAINASGCDHLILRTSWVYAAHGRNFLRSILSRAAAGEQLRVVADQFGAPTWAASIAGATASVLAQFAASDTATRASLAGIYHMTASGETSWHGFAKAIMEFSAFERKPVVHAIPGSAYPAVTSRPRNSVLSNAKLRECFGIVMPGWREALDRCMGEMTVSRNPGK
ncbi:dTDP-4-dehydrorhamnose reductase [Burkholderia sp. Leaf177]|uniref:dTDP-4-dehydrorhamnose reductase n=1 Tax=Burkholderia sp. Leaf177 TaxID=1736287 RepID=UPI0006F48F12|nr:dTDP-4-dehydrorhamnose reductase [Burkholderia sp. Leaf177]KQR85536.1 dTDP-4-dehydrorhamnose reductase [Burkholderia sp. Leaf177]